MLQKPVITNADLVLWSNDTIRTLDDLQPLYELLGGEGKMTLKDVTELQAVVGGLVKNQPTIWKPSGTSAPAPTRLHAPAQTPAREPELEIQAEKVSGLHKFVENLVYAIFPDKLVDEFKKLGEVMRKNPNWVEAIQSALAIYAANRHFIDNAEMETARNEIRKEMVDLQLIVLEILATPDLADDAKLRSDLKAKAEELGRRLQGKKKEKLEEGEQPESTWKW